MVTIFGLESARVAGPPLPAPEPIGADEGGGRETARDGELLAAPGEAVVGAVDRFPPLRSANVVAVEPGARVAGGDVLWLGGGIVDAVVVVVVVDPVPTGSVFAAMTALGGNGGGFSAPKVHASTLPGNGW